MDMIYSVFVSIKSNKINNIKYSNRTVKTAYKILL